MDAKEVQRWWKLEAMEVETPAGVMRPYGDTPEGALVYLPDGRLFMQMARKERPHFPSATLFGWTNEQARQAFDTAVAYYGRYEVDLAKRELRHFVDSSTIPNWSGTTQVRQFELAGDKLVVRYDVPLPGGAAGKVLVRWSALPGALSN